VIDHIRRLGHGGILIASPQMIFIDPWRISKVSFLADVLLITHDHYDHFSPADIERVTGPQTRIFSNERVAAQLERVEVLRAWQSVGIERTTIRAIPAYSRDHVHPRHEGGLGFYISTNLHDIYYTGDTHLIPEMELLRPDILILPIDGEGTMDAEEALQAVRLMQPRYVIPINWGFPDRGTTLREAEAFQRMVGGLAEVILG
jgi:L-ascorbate metabolism protein UlaG (beta-lactamase superfamily)